MNAAAAMLGTVVDRAVSAPFAKPRDLRRERRLVPGGGQIAEDIAASARLLKEALKEALAAEDRGESAEGTRAALFIDEAGHLWAGNLENFLALGTEDQDYVLGRMVRTARRAGRALEETARDEKWTWMWSQPPLPAPADGKPLIVRPDLLVGLDGDEGRCMTIDLKTTARTTNLDGKLDVDQLKKDFGVWRRRLRHMGFAPVDSKVLIVSTAALREAKANAKRLEVNSEVSKWR